MSIFSSIVPFAEIAFIWIVVDYFFSFFWSTRAMDVILGFGVFVLFFFLAANLGFPVLEQLLLNVMNVALITVIIIFHPEIRFALSRVKLIKKHKVAIQDFELFISNLTEVIFKLSSKKIGAIVALVRNDELVEYIRTGQQLNVDFSKEFLETIFFPSSPLHDGAVIIQGTTILTAGAILPLSQDTLKSTAYLGTRHRAALGITQKTDAFVIVVSEETGNVSIAKENVLTIGLKPEKLKTMLTKAFHKKEKKWKISNLWAKKH